MLKIAIIYEDKGVYVQFSESKFRELLLKYFDQYQDINKALDNIVMDIKLAAQKR